MDPFDQRITENSSTAVASFHKARISNLAEVALPTDPYNSKAALVLSHSAKGLWQMVRIDDQQRARNRVGE